MENDKTQEQIPRWLWIDGDKIFLNSEKTAAFFNVSPRTLINWDARSGGTLKKDTGWWDIKVMLEWKMNGEDSDEARKLKAEADYKEAQVKKAQLENDVRIGELFPANEIFKEWTGRVVELKTGLLAMGRRVGSHFTDPEMRTAVESAVQEEVFDLLGQYARNGKYTPAEKSKVSRTKKGAKNERKRKTSKNKKRA
jgi:hypothetical protein